MSGTGKRGSVIYLIVLVVFLAAGVLVITKNPYKASYQREEPVSYSEARSSYYTKAGYPAGEDIPVAKSIEDIWAHEYCTIEVSKEDITSTRTFLIKDASESGNKSSKTGRRYYNSYVMACYVWDFDSSGDISYALRQILWNMQDTSYGEWCAVTLESGERIYVLVDLNLLDFKKNKKIKLPIGELNDSYDMGRPTDDYEMFGVEEENATWYVDMVGDWEETEVGDVIVIVRLIILFVLYIVVNMFIAYISTVKKRK